MESVNGQVRKNVLLDKFFVYVKKIEEEKILKRKKNALLKEVFAAKSEFNSIKENLKLICDNDAKEYCIYRLKAAEVNLNRYIKLLKKENLRFSPFEEEAL